MKQKRIEMTTSDASPPKKQKLYNKQDVKNGATESNKKPPKKSSENISKFSKQGKSDGPTNLKKVKPKTFSQKGTVNIGKTGKVALPEKPEDWNVYKKQKKELKLKRKQIRAKDGFDVIVKAKRLGEELRKKSLKGGEEKRVQLVNELHTMLRGKGHYPKFVLAHDTARLVQWLLKYGSDIIVQQIAKVS